MLMMISVTRDVVCAALLWMMTGNMCRMVGASLSGTTIYAADVWRFGADAGNVVNTAVVVGLATAIASHLLIVPGILVGAMFMLAVPIAVERQTSAVDAIGSSWNILKAEFGYAIGFYFLVSLSVVAGLVLVGIGMAITFPVLPIALTLLYRRYCYIAANSARVPLTSARPTSHLGSAQGALNAIVAPSSPSGQLADPASSTPRLSDQGQPIPIVWLPVGLLGGAVGAGLAYNATSQTWLGRLPFDFWIQHFHEISGATETIVIYVAVGLVVGGVLGAVIDALRRR